MSRPHRRTAQLSIAAAAILGLGFAVPALQAAAEPSAAATCVEANNVWVLVQFDDTTEGGCATEFATGLEALASAGFTAEASEAGFVNTVNGEPAERGAEDWWAYAHSDDANAAWAFYLVGAKDSEPVAGSIEGWRLIHSYAEEDTFPGTTPAEVLADVEPTMSPSPTVSEPTSTPTASATPSESIPATPIATARPTPDLPHTGN